MVYAEAKRCARVEERRVECRERSSVVTPINFDAGLQRPVELGESGRSIEAGEAWTQRERKRASSGVELRQSLVEQGRDLGEDRSLRDYRGRSVSRSDIHV